MGVEVVTEVLLACYNGEKYLPPLLASLSAQGEKDFRVLMQDDGSQDGTLALLKSQGWKQVDDPSQAVDGEVAVMLSIEGCEPFDPGLHTIAEYRAHGVRMAAITWNHENTLGYPAMSGSTQGLKPYGVQAIREMQRLGIAADVSHLNEAGVFDILNKTDKPWPPTATAARWSIIPAT